MLKQTNQANGIGQNFSPDEKVLNGIDQDIARRGLRFWRKFSITLTNKRLHACQRLLFSHGQKTFDLRDIDSIYQEKRLNVLDAFGYGLLAFVAAELPIAVLFGLITHWQVLWYNRLGLATTLLMIPFGGFMDSPWLIQLGCTIISAVVFFLCLFKTTLVVRSRNDTMAIDVLRIPDGHLGDFVKAVLLEKEKIVGDVSLTSIPTTPNSAGDKLKELNGLRTQGLISDQEFEDKKKEILKNL